MVSLIEKGPPERVKSEKAKNILSEKVKSICETILEKKT